MITNRFAKGGYGTRVYGSVVGSSAPSAFFVGSTFHIDHTDCSELLWLFQSRNIDPKLCRWALSLTEFDMEMKWRAGSLHELPDPLSRLLRLNSASESAGDSFLHDDCTSSNPRDCVGPRGPVLDGQLTTTE